MAKGRVLSFCALVVVLVFVLISNCNYVCVSLVCAIVFVFVYAFVITYGFLVVKCLVCSHCILKA
jgi:hypothetical protein